MYELGGPDVRTFKELMDTMLDVIRRKRLVLNVPFFAASIMGFMFDMGSKFSGGLLPAQITRDQVRGLRHDNVVSEGAKGFADLGISPIAMDSVLPEYLWPYRPSGQYDAIKESARNLNA